jgi:hypothetical protein
MATVKRRAALRHRDRVARPEHVSEGVRKLPRLDEGRGFVADVLHRFTAAESVRLDERHV